MERKREWELVGGELDYHCEYSYSKDYYPIRDFIDEITEALEIGATHVRFEGSCHDNELWDLVIFPMKFKIESEADYKKRLNKKAAEELETQKELEAEERAEYERLKLKYE